MLKRIFIASRAQTFYIDAEERTYIILHAHKGALWDAALALVIQTGTRPIVINLRFGECTMRVEQIHKPHISLELRDWGHEYQIL